MENRVYLYGQVVNQPTAGDEFYGSEYCNLQLSVRRLSNIVDTLPLTVHKDLIARHNITMGSNIAVLGEFRSYNKLDNGRSRLMLSVFVTEITDEIDETNPNQIELTGYICKMPIYRTTPFNREIADLLIACNRSNNKSDYLPAIAWGRNARFAKNLNVGEQVEIIGRIQSRDYQKRLESGQTETRTAYEISISQIISEHMNDDANFVVNN